MPLPPFFQAGTLILVGATLIHLLFVSVFDQLPRFIGWVLTGAYAFFLYQGLFS